MNRLIKWGINISVAAGALALVLIVLKLSDMALGSYLWKNVWPGRTGIIFSIPNTTDHYVMHDYENTEVINALGFRDENVPFESQHEFRILAIGDSFTYGWGVNLEQSWVKLLEQKLRAEGLDAEVVNFGQPGGGPPDYAEIARTAVPLYRPDLVILGVLAGDDMQQYEEDATPVALVARSFPNGLKLYQHLRDHDWKLYQADPVEHDAVFTQERNKTIAAELVAKFSDQQRANYEKLDPAVRTIHQEGRLNPWLLAHSTSSPDYFLNTAETSPELETAVKALTRHFNRARRAAKAGGARVMMLSIPEGFHVNHEAWENVQRIGFQMTPDMLHTDIPDRVMRKASVEADIPYFTATEFFRERKDVKGLYLELDRHFTPRGNELFAEWAAPVVAAHLRGEGPG